MGGSGSGTGIARATEVKTAYDMRGGAEMLKYGNRINNAPYPLHRRSSLSIPAISVAAMLLISITFLSLLPGCMGYMRRSKIETDKMPKIPRRFVLLDYPEYAPFPTEAYADCALDTLWIMLNYRGIEVEKWELDSAFKPKNSEEFLGLHDLKSIAESYGAAAFEVVVDDLRILKSLAVSKMPPIVEFRYPFEQGQVSAGRPAFAIVTGHDDEKGILFVDSSCLRGVFSAPYPAPHERVCLVVLKGGATKDDVRNKLARYVPSKVLIKVLR